MLDRVISGGQTGADQGALRAARTVGIPTGGYAPQGWLTEDGPAPWLADFGLVECEEPGYPARSAANARTADGTLWFGDWYLPSGPSALDACRLHHKPFLLVHRTTTLSSDVVAWIQKHGVRVLNVAGNRESVSPGLGDRVERFLVRVFRQLAARS